MKAALAALDGTDAITACEVDAADAPALVEELGILHLPALWVFVGGEPVAEVPAETSPARLRAGLKAALNAPLAASSNHI